MSILSTRQAINLLSGKLQGHCWNVYSYILCLCRKKHLFKFNIYGSVHRSMNQ
jgi:hypothetical protein